MEDLVVSVGADITGFLSKIDAAKAKVGQLTENQGQLKAVINDLNTSLRLNERELTAATVKLQKLNTSTTSGKQAAALLRKEIAQLAANSNTLGTSLNTAKASLASTTGQLKIATAELKKAQTATGGFAGGASKAFSALRNLANIIPGIGIGGLVALIAGPLVSAFERWFEATNKISNVTSLFAKTLDGTSKTYGKAIEDVSRLKNEIQLAKQGFLNKDQVVKDYNESIGKTTGLVNSLDEAEKALNKNAAAYIKFTFLKAVANEANAESAKKAVEAALSQLKNADQFVDQGDAIGSSLKTFFLDPFSTFSENLAKSGVNLSKAAEVNRKRITDVANKDSLALADIAKKYEDEAAKLAKEFKFNFFQDTEAPKVKKTLKEVKEAVQKVVTEIKTLNATPLKLDVSQVTILDPNKLAEAVDSAVAAGKKAAALIAERVREAFAENVSAALNDMNADIAAGIGQSIGDAISGKGDFAKEIFGSIFHTLGTALQQLGKVAITTGIGIKAIKLAFKSLNPFVAIAAGVGLIALGAIIKNSVGKAAGFATGGFVSGPGTSKSDSIHARLSKGEYIINADTVSRFGKGFFDMINGGGRPRNGGFASGGSVTGGNIGGGFTQTIIPDVVVRGSDLLLVFDRASSRRGRNG